MMSPSPRRASQIPGPSGSPRAPSSVGCRKSKSTRTVLRWARARLMASWVAKVVLPSPLTALVMRTTRV